jgi:RNA polymerase-binding protein DksA
MASKRKTGTSRGKSARATPKPAKARAAKPAPKPKAAKPKAKAKPAPRPVPKPAAKAAPKAVPKPLKAAAKVATKTAGKAAPPARGGKVAGAARKPERPVAEVRPLGVLPPESRVRVSTPLPVAPPRPRPRPVAPSPSNSSEGVERVTEKDYQAFQTLLLERRSRILKEMGHLETTVLKVNPRDSAGDLSGYSFHMADAGTDAMEREKAFHFASAEGRALMEIDDALRRLHRGEYGVCESCGNPIARERLEAIPDARLCVPCKTKEEKAGRGMQ